MSDLSPSSTAERDDHDRPKRLQVLHSSKYTLLAADLRNLHPDTPTEHRINSDLLFGSTNTTLKSELPTLVLFECVLAYIAPDKADWLIEHLGRRFGDVSAVSYDIALAGDTDDASATGTTWAGVPPPSRFGRVMLQNLEVSGCSSSYSALANIAD